MDFTNIETRQKFFAGISRVVIKVGTRLLTDLNQIENIVHQIAYLKQKGIQTILVSSGAVGLGLEMLGLKKKPSKLSDIQAVASVGQSKLMSLYEKECAKHGFHAAQLLLGADDVTDKERHLNAMNCLNSLLAQNILPVINENDAVCVDELKFGDNDKLAALIAVMTKTNLTIILTAVEGLKTSPGQDGELLPVVENIDSNIKKLAGGTDGNHFSTGGMASKINAAEIIVNAGEYLIIADGRDQNIIKKLFSGEKHGTIFLPKSSKMTARKRWLGFFSTPKGKIFIDDGAVKAVKKDGKSLLPSGVINATGDFARGDTISVCSSAGEVLARGLANYSSCEIRKIAGQKSSEAKIKLGYDGDDEIIHRDNLAIIGKNS
jgi:glutamate 5-kinase